MIMKILLLHQWVTNCCVKKRGQSRDLVILFLTRDQLFVRATNSQLCTYTREMSTNCIGVCKLRSFVLKCACAEHVFLLSNNNKI